VEQAAPGGLTPKRASWLRACLRAGPQGGPQGEPQVPGLEEGVLGAGVKRGLEERRDRRAPWRGTRRAGAAWSRHLHLSQQSKRPL